MDSIGDQWQSMLAKLQDAGGRRLDPTSIALMRSNQIQTWIDHGMSFDLDILPAIRDSSKRGSSIIHSWTYFDRAVRQFHAKRQRAKVAPSPIADSKGFNRDEPPIDPPEVRKRAVRKWREEIRDG